MATTTGGSTYVTSTDLVANYPTASLALANRVDVVASGSMSKKTASYTATVADILAGTTICMNSASATVITLPSTSLVNGMQLSVFSVNTGAVTFTGGTVTGTSTSITAQYSGLTLTYDSAAAVWWSLPFAAGSAIATVTGTTGSPTITTVGSKTIYKFTGDGTITIGGSGGTCDVLLAGGGGGGGRLTVAGYYGGSGGGGGYQYLTGLYIAAGTYNVKIGAGGSGSTGPANNGGMSYVQSVSYAFPGGGGAGDGGGAGGNNGDTVGSGGGGNNYTGFNVAGGPGTPGQGYAGASGYTSGAVGAGGGAGGAASGTTAGPGVSNSITGSAVTYCGGGQNGSGAGGANTGKGGGSTTSSGVGSAGGSGVVIFSIG